MALHGGGNQEASTVMARSFTDWDYLKNLVRAATGMEKDPARVDEIIGTIGRRQGRICTNRDLPQSGNK